MRGFGSGMKRVSIWHPSQPEFSPPFSQIPSVAWNTIDKERCATAQVERGQALITIALVLR